MFFKNKAKQLIVLGLLLACMCMVTGCTRNNQDDNDSGDMAGTDIDSTTQTAAPATEPDDDIPDDSVDTNDSLPDDSENSAGTIIDDAGNAVGDVIDDAGNVVGDTVDDITNGVSDIVDDATNDVTNSGNTSSTTTDAAH